MTESLSHMGLRSSPVVTFESGTSRSKSTDLAVEELLQVNLNGAPYTTTLRTPGEDKILVRGLLFTERLVVDLDAPCVIAESRDSENGNVAFVDVYVPPRFLNKRAEHTRTVLATSSCGMCGQREVVDPFVDAHPLHPSGPLEMCLVHSLVSRMEGRQGLFKLTGGTHGAAAFSARGELLAACEDIGRHNAVDKVIGALIRDSVLGQALYLTVSGRVSYEIVTKAYRAGVPYIVAVSAPSSLAVDAAERHGMTIIGFCRDTRATVYSCRENVQFEE